MGKGYSSYDRGSRSYAYESDRCKYGDPENLVPRRTVLRFRAVGNCCCPGYDHITSAIGGAIAAAAGAYFLCYVTPAEQLRLPNADNVKEGIVAAKIAAHAADIAKGIPNAADWDHKMSEARKHLDWDELFKLSIDPEKARRYRAESRPEKEDTCSMCGNFCAVKNTNRILDGEIVSIFDE